MDSRDIEFESWYQEVHPRLSASLALAFGSPELAQDSADEATVRAFERWSKVSAMESPTGWYFRVGFNVARRRLRRQRLERDLLHRHREADTIPGPESELWLVVSSLPSRQRQAVLLRHVGQLREREIGAVMGIGRGAVSSTLRAAYKSLRVELTDPSPQEIR